jgi:ATP-dependent RNA helicase DeaD
MKFDELGLIPELLAAVQDLKFTTPTPIQAESIPVLLSGESDFVGLAQTGTGKTGAYGLGMLQRIDPTRTDTQGIVICPTRELCLQITNDLQAFSKKMNKVQIVAVYGGASISDQIRLLKRGAQIIVATPGRLMDLSKRKAVHLNQIDYAVLDEADEMLNMGFQEDIETILGKMPETRRIWLFSATMPRGVARIANNILKDPVEVTVGGKNESAQNIEHSYCMVHEKHRYLALKRLLDYAPEMYGLIFCRTRKETQDVAEKLIQDGYQAESLHGDLSQSQRDAVMRKFRQRNVMVLVATDVAARGLDVDDITHVIHYRLPDDEAIYTHRSGRTARAGKSGKSIAIVNTREKRTIQAVERRSNITFSAGKIPDGRDICEKQLFSLVKKIKNTPVNQKDIEQYLPRVFESFEEFDKEELIKHFISAEFNRFLDYYRHAADINFDGRSARGDRDRGPRTREGRGDRSSGRRDARSSGERSPRSGAGRPARRDPRDSGDRGTQRSRPPEAEMKRFFFGAGELDRINPGAIVRTVCESAGITRNQIGHISINREFSFFDVHKKAADQVVKSMHNTKVDGRDVQVREFIEMPRKKGGGTGAKKPRS